MQYQHDLKSTLWCSFLHNTEQICPAARNTGHQGYINTKMDNIRVISKTLPDWHFLHTRSASLARFFVAQLISCGDATKLSRKWLCCLYRIGFELLFVVAVYTIVPCTKIIIDPVKCEQRLDLPLVVSPHSVAYSPTSFLGSLSYPFSLGP